MTIKTDWKWDSERAEVKGIDDGSVRVLVARVWGKDPEQIDEHGRLVAAAPDLLEALKKLADLVFSYKPEPGSVMSNVAHSARAVIAKAEGE